MQEEDKIEFDIWVSDFKSRVIDGMPPTPKQIWAAAIEVEKKRSVKLVEALENNPCECSWPSILKATVTCHRCQALKEYRGEK